MDSPNSNDFDYDKWAPETGLNEWAEEDLQLVLLSPLHPPFAVQRQYIRILTTENPTKQERQIPRYRHCFQDASMPVWSGQCPRCWQQMNLLRPDEAWIHGGVFHMPLR